MAVFMKFAGILALFCVIAQSAKLPSYITACRADDPDLNACAQKNGQAALASFIKGDKDYKIPVLSPLKIDHIGLTANKNLQINVNDVEIKGFEGAIMKDVSINLDEKKASVTLFIPLVNIMGQYEMDGKILILPIQGNGPCNISSVNGNYTYSMSYELHKNKKGVEHAKITDHNVVFVTERAYFQFKNLFNGDKVLGEQMSLFLDENWADVIKELGPAVSDTISQVITVILTAIFDRVPFSKIFI